MADNNDKNNKSRDQSIVPPKKKRKADVMDERPLCKYGESCYQKNTFHLTKYRHPHREESAVLQEEDTAEAFVYPHEEESETEFSSSARQDSDGGKADPSRVSDDEHEEENDTEPSSSARQDSDGAKADPSPASDDEHEEEEHFLTEMPEDFYSFWKFCCTVNEKTPCSALKELLGLELVGPFKQLDESDCAVSKKMNYLNDWRFYYDPPEFQSVLVGDSTSGYHIGYFRDNPLETPVFVGSNTESEGCTINQLGDNLFTSLGRVIDEKLKKANPFNKPSLVKLKKQVNNWAEEHNISLENQIMKARSGKVVAKTFYQCGIVVPVDKKSNIGYRDIPESNATIKKICKKIVDAGNSAEQDANFDPLQELVRYVQYANDELDYGMGLELGLDLLAYGGEVFHSTILHLLGVAYELLDRPEFFTVLKIHLASRKKIASKE